MKALIAMSGGVDSSVSALRAKEMGFDCTGCTMRLYENNIAGISGESSCCSLSDIEDARNVAYSLSMPYYVFNFQDEFREKVINRFVSGYLSGITPNPCIDCNRYMKFDQLYERGKILGCDYIVTGHYARIEEDHGTYRLLKAADRSKDQSYVLYTMTQYQLAHTLFPLGELSKSEVRQIAEKHGFVNSDKPDSQDICFVPDGDYAGTIQRLTGKQAPPGDYIDLDGNVLGRHQGIIHYTLGQHRGLGLSLGHTAYVCGIDAANNTVTLGNSEDLFCHIAYVKDFHWISGTVPSSAFRCNAKVRYRHTEQPATVEAQADGHVRITFDEAQRAITPGQSAVLYDGEYVLGGGIIDHFEK